MRLSQLLSRLYPDGFGLDLIDRAESLGKSIFEFVKKATDENKTILAAIVADNRPRCRIMLGYSWLKTERSDHDAP